MTANHNISGVRYEEVIQGGGDSSYLATYIANSYGFRNDEFFGARAVLIRLAEGIDNDHDGYLTELDHAIRAAFIAKAAGHLGLTVSGEVK